MPFSVMGEYLIYLIFKITIFTLCLFRFRLGTASIKIDDEISLPVYESVQSLTPIRR